MPDQFQLECSCSSPTCTSRAWLDFDPYTNGVTLNVEQADTKSIMLYLNQPDDLSRMAGWLLGAAVTLTLMQEENNND